MAKIYVASSWRNSYQLDVVSFLRNEGHEVYDFKNPPHGNGGFQWSDIDPNWQYWTTAQYREALNHPIAQKGLIQISMVCSGRMFALWFSLVVGRLTQKPDG